MLYDWGNYRQNGQTVQGGEFVQCIQKNHERSVSDLTWGVQRPQMFERIGCELSIQTYDVSSGTINLWYVQRGLCLGGLKILLQPLVQTPLHSYPTTSPNLGKHVPNSSSTLVIESLRKKWALNHWLIHWKWSYRAFSEPWKRPGCRTLSRRNWKVPKLWVAVSCMTFRWMTSIWYEIKDALARICQHLHVGIGCSYLQLLLESIIPSQWNLATTYGWDNPPGFLWGSDHMDDFFPRQTWLEQPPFTSIMQVITSMI